MSEITNLVYGEHQISLKKTHKKLFIVVSGNQNRHWCSPSLLEELQSLSELLPLPDLLASSPEPSTKHNLLSGITDCNTHQTLHK